VKVKITKRSVEAIRAESGRVTLMDTVVPGFGCRITPNGVRTYVLKYSRGNRARWVTIGRHGDVTPDEARVEAIKLRGVIAKGADPAAEHAALRAVPLLSAFAQRYLAEHAALKKKPRSKAEDERILEKHVTPALGNLRVSDVSHADVQRLHHAMRKTPTLANRCLALISTMMNLVERWGLRPIGSNPARYVEKYPERKRERLLSAEELSRLGKTLRDTAAAGANPSVIAAIRLLIFTGCRLREILTLRWDQVDLHARCLRLPESKTGAKVVYLGAPALELLSAMPRVPGNPFVLPGLKPGRHYVGIEKAWAALRAKANVPDLRIHDLRHAFASAGAAGGESLIVIGRLLGHASPTMTARYAHLAPDPAQAAADRIARAQAAKLDGGSAMVIAFDRAGRKARGGSLSGTES
jgi:integrase